jgi:Flp pilus assembly protein TadD
MSTRMSFRAIIMSLFFIAVEVSEVSLVRAQDPPDAVGVQMPGHAGSLIVTIAVRDLVGGQLQTPATVHLYSAETGYEETAITGAMSNAVFSVPPGNYKVDVRCDGYQQGRDEVTVSVGSYFEVMLRPAEGATKSRTLKGSVMTPQLQKIVTKGLDAMRVRDCDLAEKEFQKGVQMAPGNPDLAFLLGTAEFCLQHTDLARQDFERAVNLDPSHGRALLALGEMQLAAKETSFAIATLEKAQSVNASDWRVHSALANAYWRVGHRLNDAEAQAAHAVKLTNDKNGSARLLLGEIQYAQGNVAEARKTWRKLIDDLPSDPATATAKRKLENSAPGAPKTIPDSESRPPISSPQVRNGRFAALSGSVSFLFSLPCFCW